MNLVITVCKEVFESGWWKQEWSALNEIRRARMKMNWYGDKDSSILGNVACCLVTKIHQPPPLPFPHAEVKLLWNEQSHFRSFLRFLSGSRQEPKTAMVFMILHKSPKKSFCAHSSDKKLAESRDSQNCTSYISLLAGSAPPWVWVLRSAEHTVRKPHTFASDPSTSTLKEGAPQLLF